MKTHFSRLLLFLLVFTTARSSFAAGDQCEMAFAAAQGDQSSTFPRDPRRFIDTAARSMSAGARQSGVVRLAKDLTPEESEILFLKFKSSATPELRFRRFDLDKSGESSRLISHLKNRDRSRANEVLYVEGRNVEGWRDLYEEALATGPSDFRYGFMIVVAPSILSAREADVIARRLSTMSRFSFVID